MIKTPHRVKSNELVVRVFKCLMCNEEEIEELKNITIFPPCYSELHSVGEGTRFHWCSEYQNGEMSCIGSRILKRN
jgi:hypothetical protein